MAIGWDASAAIEAVFGGLLDGHARGRQSSITVETVGGGPLTIGQEPWESDVASRAVFEARCDRGAVGR